MGAGQEGNGASVGLGLLEMFFDRRLQLLKNL